MFVTLCTLNVKQGPHPQVVPESVYLGSLGSWDGMEWECGGGMVVPDPDLWGWADMFVLHSFFDFSTWVFYARLRLRKGKESWA